VFGKKDIIFWDVTQCNPVNFTYVSVERIVYIFRVLEKAERRQAASNLKMDGENLTETLVKFAVLHDFTSQKIEDTIKNLCYLFISDFCIDLSTGPGYVLSKGNTESKQCIG
jgi:hypothetical protein